MEKGHLWSDVLDTPIHQKSGDGFELKYHATTGLCCLFFLLQSPFLEKWSCHTSWSGTVRSLRQSRVLFLTPAHLKQLLDFQLRENPPPLPCPQDQTDKEGCWKIFLSWLLAWDPLDISFNKHAAPPMPSVFPGLCMQYIAAVVSVFQLQDFGLS